MPATAMPKKDTISKRSFDDAIGGVHAHTFGLDPDAEEYLLTVLEREYIAYALALYYNCSHCQEYHGRVVDRLRKKDSLPERQWRKDVARAILFLRVEIDVISSSEREEWMQTWRSFGSRINQLSLHLPCYIASAIGMARDDDSLIELVGRRFSEVFPDKDDRTSRTADILEVVSFMKAAASKNRVEPKVISAYGL